MSIEIIVNSSTHTMRVPVKISPGYRPQCVQYSYLFTFFIPFLVFSRYTLPFLRILHFRSTRIVASARVPGASLRITSAYVAMCRLTATLHVCRYQASRIAHNDRNRACSHQLTPPYEHLPSSSSPHLMPPSTASSLMPTLNFEFSGPLIVPLILV